MKSATRFFNFTFGYFVTGALAVSADLTLFTALRSCGAPSSAANFIGLLAAHVITFVGLVKISPPSLSSKGNRLRFVWEFVGVSMFSIGLAVALFELLSRPLSDDIAKLSTILLVIILRFATSYFIWNKRH